MSGRPEPVPREREREARTRPEGAGRAGAEALLYAAVVALCLLGAVFVLRLWGADLRVPLHFAGDSTYNLAMTKGVAENGWFTHNPRLGAPGEMDILDFPSGDGLHWLAIKALVAMTGGAATAMNLWFLAGFPLAGACALWAFRRCGLSRPMALLASVLYALAPYHFLRGLEHLMLSGYFLVPPVLAFALSLFGDRPALTAEADGRRRLALRAPASIGALAVCALSGVAGIYYAIFGSFFLGVAGAVGARKRRERARLVAAAVMIAVTMGAAAAGLAPFITHRATVGPNPQVAARRVDETFTYGLRINEMLLPVTDHRVPRLAAMRERWAAGLRRLRVSLDNESQWSALGIVGAAGFLVLLAVSLAGARRRGGPGEHLEGVAALNLAGVLLATVGGFGALVAMKFPWIRGYNRISVLLAFFALLAVGVLADAAVARLAAGRRTAAGWALAALLLAVGVFDQTTPAMAPDHAAARARTETLAAFVAQVEAGLPEGAMVLQLPYVPFPEHGPTYLMADYDHLQAYLYSGRARWSGGAVMGSEAAEWQERVSALPAAHVAAEARARGFAGVWVDRFGLIDDGAALVGGLTEALGVSPVESADGRYAYFALGR